MNEEPIDSLVVATDLAEIAVNAVAIEPNAYFRLLKSKLQENQAEALSAQLSTLSEQLIAAKQIGQQRFLERVAFTYDVMLKEQSLLAAGHKTFVYSKDIEAFIDNTTPKNSVKIIELERFPRAIPLEPMRKIAAAKELGIFDEFCVVFTDLTGEEYTTPEEKALVGRNRDPIVFGYFYHKDSGIKHDRFCLIADWEDEHCDLTFARMIEKMAKQGIKKPAHEIATDPAYVQELVAATLEEMKARKDRGFSNAHTIAVLDDARRDLEQATAEPKGFWGRLWKR